MRPRIAIPKNPLNPPAVVTLADKEDSKEVAKEVRVERTAVRQVRAAALNRKKHPRRGRP